MHKAKNLIESASEEQTEARPNPIDPEITGKRVVYYCGARGACWVYGAAGEVDAWDLSPSVLLICKWKKKNGKG
jgi:hypothetical protein